ncbi:protein NDH-DEPENDENT CYCLIC ELECTRON FLOW 5 [Arachis stenosperma]|uniref:protein NDH-DEPENDENT CYCLIC ELECTRON FLOW 5 n=1 Tax=Arachis stenosperma TaxID=217475 RepID=UPI0025ABCD20|nr:protein NDH-DEPENDENT CYCLIC ELECTRON FLOW 5 [Arachis stenosperma]
MALITSLLLPTQFNSSSSLAITCAINTPSHTYFKFPLGNHTFNCCKPLAAVASSVPYQPTNNLDYLEKEEFIGHDGVTFEAVGDGSVVAKMELKNGSVVSMLLPSGVITSYKAPMWHGGTVELLHTAVSEGDHGAALIQGGVSSNFTFTTDDCQVSFSPTHWVLSKIKSHPEESIKIELLNKSSEDKIGIKYIVTLEEDGLQSEFEVQNSMHSPLQITGSILSHLTVSSPEATYAVGLERSNYWRRPLLESEFILSPPPDSNYQEGFGKIWNIPALQQLIPHWGATKDQNKEDMSGEEDDGYKNLRDKISLIYTDAPRSITVIDRGRRNSLSIGRIGLDEMYLFSPGSKVEIYSKYSYILVGQTAIFKPIVVNPQDVWNGGQYIHNPNL